jgi:glycosyltransferase involved in cell wall biosynthesis
MPAPPPRPRTTWPAVSAILTVLNEERHLRDAIRSVLEQDYPGEIEVVISLGPSRDRTDEVAAELAAADPRVHVVRNPSGRTPEGLNAALAVSSHPVVARVDGHAELPADYLRVAVDLLDRTGAVNVGGLMWAEGHTSFEQAVAAAMTSRFGVGNARFHVGGDEGPADTVYLGVFRRDALDAVGGYDEAFTRAQDWEMNYRLRRAGGLVWFTPLLRVAYRPRGSVGALARQYYNYGKWRAEVMRRHPDTVSLRYLAPPLALLAMTAGVLLGVAGAWWHWLLLGWAAPAGYLAGVLLATAVVGRELGRPVRRRLAPVFATMHVSWGTGFLVSITRYRRRGLR